MREKEREEMRMSSLCDGYEENGKTALPCSSLSHTSRRRLLSRTPAECHSLSSLSSRSLVCSEWQAERGAALIGSLESVGIVGNSHTAHTGVRERQPAGSGAGMSSSCGL